MRERPRTRRRSPRQSRAGWGSALVETQLAWYGLPYRLEGVGDLFKEEGAGEKLRPVNPLMQLPTLVLPDGQIMTESAAITLYLAEATGRSDLVPPPPRPQLHQGHRPPRRATGGRRSRRR